MCIVYGHRHRCHQTRCYYGRGSALMATLHRPAGHGFDGRQRPITSTTTAAERHATDEATPQSPSPLLCRLSTPRVGADRKLGLTNGALSDKWARSSSRTASVQIHLVVVGPFIPRCHSVVRYDLHADACVRLSVCLSVCHRPVLYLNG